MIILLWTTVIIIRWPPCYPPPFKDGLNPVTCFLWIKYGRCDGMPFARWVYKKTVVSTFDTLFSSRPCCELPCFEVHVARTWGRPLAVSSWGNETLSLITYEEMGLASNQVRKARSRSFHRQVFRCDCSPGWQFTPSWEPWVTGTHRHCEIIRHLWDLSP